MRMDFRFMQEWKKSEKGKPDKRKVVTQKEFQNKSRKGLLISGLIVLFGFLSFPLLSFFGPLLGIVLAFIMFLTLVPTKIEYKVVEDDGVTPIPEGIIENEKARKKQKGTFRFVLEYVFAIAFIILMCMFIWVIFYMA
ncbi:MAG: hypothetical protein ACRC1M_07310 [Methanobacteriaceae archaeon]